ncbi:MAG: NAD(P)-dependent alcohol dehydrogenase, partial [Acidobacteria bacterium]|nr:NAD(P)-dependent alcohol dehydrogenase [Acidobacteriota bacterium]
MGWFRRAAPTEPLAITMTGVKLGDRLLVIGAGDPRLIAALATKSGLTGRASVVDAD